MHFLQVKGTIPSVWIIKKLVCKLGASACHWSHIVSCTQCHGLGHLLHSALTSPPRANARCLESRQSFVPAEQQSSVRLMTTTEVRRSGRITDRMRSFWTTLRDSVLSPPTLAPTLLEWLCQGQRGSGFNHLLTGVGHFRSCLHKWLWPLLRPVSVAQKTNCPPCCPQMSNPSTSPWTARPDVSGWRYNRMAFQHLPQDPVRPSSGLKQLAQTIKRYRSYSWK